MNPYRGRRPAPRSSRALPDTPCRLKAPTWPFPPASDAETALWRDLWHRPVAHLWHRLHVAPVVVGRYVRTVLANPSSATLASMESALGLTPASLNRLSITFGEPEDQPGADPEIEALIARVRDR